MWSRSFFDCLRFGSRKRPRRLRRSAASQLQLEALEDRWLPSFASPVSYAVGTNPDAVVTADLNGDGHLDLAVANYSSHNVSVLLGNADGSFQPAQNYSIGSNAWNPHSLAVGDVNDDGQLDLVTGNTTTAGSDSVSVLLGNGDGSFQAAQSSFPSEYYDDAQAVTMGDFNSDGKLDLAVSKYYPGYVGWGYGYGYGWGWYSYGWPATAGVSVILGHGDGTFTETSSYSLSYGDATSLVTGDFNGDGETDLVAGSGDLLLGNGDGTFSYGAWTGVTNHVFAADFDNDGDLDLAGSGRIALNNEDGTFPALQEIAYFSPRGVGDFNGDGNTDLVAYYSGNLGVLLGNGDGSFRGPEYADAGSYAVASTGDFNGDGQTDLAVANYYGGVSVLLNTNDWRSFVISGLASSTTAGAASTFTVTALDSNGNPLTDYTGTVHFTSSDPQADLPADYTFTAADNGTHTFSVTLKTAGTQSITVTDTGPTAFSGTQNHVTVSPAAVSAFQVGGYPSSTSVGSLYNYLTIQAVDAYGNWVTNYTGTVHFSSSDSKAELFPDYTFGEYDYGTGAFPGTFNTVGVQSITVSDTANPAATGSQTGIQVNPAATISGPQGGVPNQTLTFTLGAVSGLPADTTFTYAIDWNNDGAVDQTVTGPDGTTVEHSYAGSGDYAIGVTATVHLGADDYTSYVSYRYVHITGITVTVAADAGDPSRSALLIEGTAGGDSITLTPGSGNSISVWEPGYNLGEFSAPGGAAFAHVIVNGNAGDDFMYLSGDLGVPALIFGGDGNDVIGVSDSTANNVLVGGAGSDSLYGGNGRDLLIGGLGADFLYGRAGDDILIGGTTSYDANTQALIAIMKEWGRTDTDYATRIKHLQGSGGGRLNGSYVLTRNTVQKDGNAIDYLYGEDGMDWFVVSGKGKRRDKVNGAASGEVITTI